jgi:hypothetical protein
MWKLCLLWYDLHVSNLVKIGNDDFISFEQKIKIPFIKKYFTGKKILIISDSVSLFVKRPSIFTQTINF